VGVAGVRGSVGGLLLALRLKGGYGGIAGVLLTIECSAPFDSFHLFAASITNRPRSLRPRSPFFDTLPILIPPRQPTLSAYALSSRISRREGRGRRGRRWVLYSDARGQRTAPRRSLASTTTAASHKFALLHGGARNDRSEHVCLISLHLPRLREWPHTFSYELGR